MWYVCDFMEWYTRTGVTSLPLLSFTQVYFLNGYYFVSLCILILDYNCPRDKEPCKIDSWVTLGQCIACSFYFIINKANYYESVIHMNFIRGFLDPFLFKMWVLKSLLAGNSDHLINIMGQVKQNKILDWEDAISKFTQVSRRLLKGKAW